MKNVLRTKVHSFAYKVQVFIKS